MNRNHAEQMQLARQIINARDNVLLVVGRVAAGWESPYSGSLAEWVDYLAALLGVLMDLDA